MLTKESSGVVNPTGRPLVASLDQVNMSDVALVGGKGASLGEMIQKGVPVPHGFAVTTAAFQEFLCQNHLNEMVERLLARPDLEDSSALAQASQRIRSVFLVSPPPQAAEEAIRKAYQLLGEGPVAVRSSATAEDLPHASFAGQHSTFLYVEGVENVIRAVVACWASLFEERAIFYRETKGFRHRDVSIAVLVQRMVDSEVSGALFTADPTTGNQDVVVIEAVYGLGEPLVSGQLSPDLWLVDKATLQVTSCQVQTQPWALRWNRQVQSFDQGTKRCPVPVDCQSLPKLSGSEPVRQLVRLGLALQRHYGCPQDIEWAVSGGKVYILQSRPITTLNGRSKPASSTGDTVAPLISGAAASPGVGVGRAQVVRDASEMNLVQPGAVLVTEMTTPDFVPAMKRAAAIVTDRGGRTCHAAIVSREMGIPCVVGTGKATQVLSGSLLVTVDGTAGKVYPGDARSGLGYTQAAPGAQAKIKTKTRLYVNLAEPAAAERVAKMDVDGVGLLRAEFVMAHIGEHPRAMLESGRGSEFIGRLAEGLESFAKAFAPRPVVYRFADFKTNEYRNLRGGDAYEPQEENPMLGYRGCARYLAEPDLFQLEVAAVKKTRERFPNLWVMLPFVRTVDELRGVKQMLEEQGLRRSPSAEGRSHDFQLWMMLEVPSNVLLLDQFLDVGIDGISIGSNDLTQLILGVDRDSARLAHIFDERNPAVLCALERVIRACRERGVTASICGQAPSEYPELTRQLVSWGITSVSVSPDMLQKTRSTIHQVELEGMG